MLEGKSVNLRIMEKEDLPLFVEWVNNPEVFGEYNPARAHGEMMGSCRIYLLHYLDVHVLDSVAQEVPSAVVSAFCMNSTLAESETTDSNGWARLTLIEKMKNATESILTETTLWKPFTMLTQTASRLT